MTGYATNPVVFGLAALAVVWGVIRRDRLALGLAAWSALMWVLSGPRFAGAFMDTISVLISLYFPAAVAIGWMTVNVIETLARRTGQAQAVRGAGWAAVAALGIWGGTHIATILEPAGGLRVAGRSAGDGVDPGEYAARFSVHGEHVQLGFRPGFRDQHRRGVLAAVAGGARDGDGADDVSHRACGFSRIF